MKRRRKKPSPMSKILVFVAGVLLGVSATLSYFTFSEYQNSPPKPANPRTNIVAHGSWIHSNDGGSYTISALGYGKLYSNVAFSNEVSATEHPVEVRSEGYTIQIDIVGWYKKTVTMTAGESLLIGVPEAYLYVIVV